MSKRKHDNFSSSKISARNTALHTFLAQICAFGSGASQFVKSRFHRHCKDIFWKSKKVHQIRRKGASTTATTSSCLGTQSPSEVHFPIHTLVMLPIMLHEVRQNPTTLPPLLLQQCQGQGWHYTTLVTLQLSQTVPSRSANSKCVFPSRTLGREKTRTPPPTAAAK
jgi:hypothetical protein